MDREIANRFVDMHAEITALRGAIRMLLHNVHNADESALAVVREEAYRAAEVQLPVEDDGSTAARYRERVREAVASLLDPFQPDDDEASRLSNPSR